MFENLTGLTFHVRGGFAGIDEQLTIADGRITYTNRGNSNGVSAAFSSEDRTQLAEVLTAADFAKTAGTYRQNLMDGFTETLTVAVTVDTATKRYRVINCGTAAPAAYYTVTAYLRELQRTKFLSSDQKG